MFRSNILKTNDGQRLAKNKSGNTWSTGYAYTTQILRGGCSLTFNVHDTNTAFMFGLSDNQSNSSRHVNIDYAWYPTHNSDDVCIYMSREIVEARLQNMEMEVFSKLHTTMHKLNII